MMTGKRRKSSSPSSSSPAKKQPNDKIREILQQLKKVDSVTSEIRLKIDELDSWKVKLEGDLFTYLNDSSNLSQSTHSNPNPNKASSSGGGGGGGGTTSAMNSPINLGHANRGLPLYHPSMTTMTNPHNPNPINHNPNNYGGSIPGEFNPEQLLGVGLGQLHNTSIQNGPVDPSWFNPNLRIPSTTGLFNPTHFPNPHLMMLNNKERT